jgi:hypothetical protein
VRQIHYGLLDASGGNVLWTGVQSLKPEAHSLVPLEIGWLMGLIGSVPGLDTLEQHSIVPLKVVRRPTKGPLAGRAIDK